MNAPARLVYQDGGQFYDDATGAVVADYGDTGSLAVAKAHRARFVAEHPECFFEGAQALAQQPREVRS